MAKEFEEELNHRRQERALRKQQEQAKLRKLRLKLILAAVVLIGAFAAIGILTGGNRTPDDAVLENPTVETEAPTTEETTQETTSARNPTTTIHIKAAGDLNITDSVILAGAGAGGYNFTGCFQDVAGVRAEANLTMLNIEGNFCGEPYGSATTSAPIQLAEALKAAGVDIVQMANSCSVNNGIIGLGTTLRNLRAAGLEPIGAYATEEEFERAKGYTICEIEDIKVAIVAFTKGVGSRGLPTGSENCVNLLYTDFATTYSEVDTKRIKQILQNAASEKPDITIAMLHWGSEYNDTISSTQKEIISLMQNQGVDVIIGTHPHMVHSISYDETTGNLVAYSLGDFFGDATRSGTAYSIILDVEITKDHDLGTTRVTGYSITPIYTLTEAEAADSQRRVVRIREAMLAYEFQFMNRVSASAYSNMEYSLVRIEDRIKVKEEKK